jgi:hypothetical protein
MIVKSILKPLAVICLATLLVCGIFMLVRQPASATAAAQRLDVHPQYDLVYAYGWDDGVPITLTVTNDEGDILTVVTTTVSGGAADFSFTGFDFQPLQTLIAFGEGMTKTYTATNPILTDIDPANDTISGTGKPGERMQVTAFPRFNRWATIDGDGNWMVDFKTASDPADTPGSLDLIGGSTGSSNEQDSEGDQTWANDWCIPAPVIGANPFWNEVSAHGMPIGTVLTLTVSMSDTVVYTSPPTPVIQQWDNPDEISARFDMMGFDVKAGQKLIASSVEASTTYTVTVFAITAIDPLSDTVSGISTPGVVLQICANTPDHCAMRYPVADDMGKWVADFSKPGPHPNEQEIVDIHPASNGWGNETDDQGNSTSSAWNVLNPRFEARPNIDQVRGWDWTSGEILTLDVGGQVITGTVSDPSYIEFNLSGIYDIQAGDVISLTNGTITKTTTVTELAITRVDVDEDTVSGIAAPGSNVDMWVCYTTDWINTYRHVTADGNGNWVADFSVFGDDPDEQNTFDILPGTWVDSQQVDEDSDATMYGMTVPNPSIYAHLNENRVDIFEFPAEDSVEMMIKGTDVYTTMTGVTDLNGYANFDLGWSFTLEPGQVITVTNDTITKTLTVMDLYVDSFDPMANTVSGHSDPNVELAVNVWIDNGGQSVQADASGSWTAAYDTSLGPWFPTTRGDVTSWDGDGDATVYFFNTGMIFAWPPAGIELAQCMNYRTYTLTIDDPSNGPGVDYTDTQPVEKPGSQTVVNFQLTGFEINAGDLITITAGHDVRTLVMPPQGEISFDVENDIISGVNQPDGWVANIGSVTWRDVKTDATGAWSVDYSVPGPKGEPVEDIVYGMNGWTLEYDVDGDFTSYYWRVLAYIYLPSVNR